MSDMANMADMDDMAAIAGQTEGAVSDRFKSREKLLRD